MGATMPIRHPQTVCLRSVLTEMIAGLATQPSVDDRQNSAYSFTAGIALRQVMQFGLLFICNDHPQL